MLGPSSGLWGLPLLTGELGMLRQPQMLPVPSFLINYFRHFPIKVNLHFSCFNTVCSKTKHLNWTRTGFAKLALQANLTYAWPPVSLILTVIRPFQRPCVFVCGCMCGFGSTCIVFRSCVCVCRPEASLGCQSSEVRPPPVLTTRPCPFRLKPRQAGQEPRNLFISTSWVPGFWALAWLCEMWFLEITLRPQAYTEGFTNITGISLDCALYTPINTTRFYILALCHTKVNWRDCGSAIWWEVLRERKPVRLDLSAWLRAQRARRLPPVPGITLVSKKQTVTALAEQSQSSHCYYLPHSPPLPKHVLQK